MEDENGSFPIQAELTLGIYHFDQFNVKVDFPSYTNDEYELFLQGLTQASKSDLRSRLDQGRNRLFMEFMR
jgi:hypothetical protein